MSKKILVLPGDYIGPEIIAEAVKVLERVSQQFGLGLDLQYGLLGGAAIDAHGVPLPESTLERARAVDAILLGAVGGPKWDGVERHLRPEKGLLAIRSELQLFGNLRPAILYPQLAEASSSASHGESAPWRTASAKVSTLINTVNPRFAGSPTWRFPWHRNGTSGCARWTSPTCWRRPSCGGKSWRRSRPSIPT
jgi:hypothetical protein